MTSCVTRRWAVLLLALLLCAAMGAVASANMTSSYLITSGGVSYGATLTEEFFPNAGGAGINLFQYSLVVPQTVPNYHPQTQISKVVISNPDSIVATSLAALSPFGWAASGGGAGDWVFQKVSGPNVNGIQGVFQIFAKAVEGGVNGKSTFAVVGDQTVGTLGPRVASTPEPASLSLLAIGALGLLPVVRRRRAI
jgi:hypothetical protein